MRYAHQRWCFEAFEPKFDFRLDVLQFDRVPSIHRQSQSAV